MAFSEYMNFTTALGILFCGADVIKNEWSFRKFQPHCENIACAITSQNGHHMRKLDLEMKMVLLFLLAMCPLPQTTTPIIYDYLFTKSSLRFGLLKRDEIV